MFEMEHGVAGEDEVVADLDIVSDKVVLFKLPALIAELLPVSSYGWYNFTKYMQ